MSCKYQKHARYQEGRIRYLEQELKVARENIIFLKAGGNSSKIRDQEISDDSRPWNKPENSKSRSCRFSADHAPHVQLSNRLCAGRGSAKHKFLEAHGRQSKTTCWEDKK
jgi:hypothetical protein